MALLLVGSTGATADGAQQARVHDETVWVSWSAAASAEDEATIEAIYFRIESGESTVWAIGVENDGDSAIQNVTLVLTRTQGIASYRFGHTYAGDPSLEDYGFWHNISGGREKIMPFTMAVVKTETETPFVAEFLVFFERDGVPSFAKTTWRGRVVPSAADEAEGVEGEPARHVAGNAVTLAVAAAAGAAQGLRRRK